MKQAYLLPIVAVLLALPALAQEKQVSTADSVLVPATRAISVTLAPSTPLTITGGTLGWSTSSESLGYLKGDERIESTALKGGQLIVAKSRVDVPAFAYACMGCSQPEPIKRVWREVYGVKDGKIELLRTEQAKVIPEQRTAEKIVWPNEKD